MRAPRAVAVPSVHNSNPFKMRWISEIIRFSFVANCLALFHDLRSSNRNGNGCTRDIDSVYVCGCFFYGAATDNAIIEQRTAARQRDEYNNLFDFPSYIELSPKKKNSLVPRLCTAFLMSRVIFHIYLFVVVVVVLFSVSASSLRVNEQRTGNNDEITNQMK